MTKRKGTEQRSPRSVLVEMRSPPATAPLESLALGAALPGFTRDEEYQPVAMAGGPDGGGPTVIIRGTVDDDEAVSRIEARPEVVQVWSDTPVEPFPGLGPFT